MGTVQETIVGVEGLLAWLKTLPGGCYCGTMGLLIRAPETGNSHADFVASARLLPNPRCKHRDDDIFTVTHRFTADISVWASAWSSAVCTRVQVGTQHVEAQEAHDEPIYEYDCTRTSRLLAPSNAV